MYGEGAIFIDRRLSKSTPHHMLYQMSFQIPNTIERLQANVASLECLLIYLVLLLIVSRGDYLNMLGANIFKQLNNNIFWVSTMEGLLAATSVNPFEALTFFPPRRASVLPAPSAGGGCVRGGMEQKMNKL